LYHDIVSLLFLSLAKRTVRRGLRETRNRLASTGFNCPDYGSDFLQVGPLDHPTCLCVLVKSQGARCNALRATFEEQPLFPGRALERNAFVAVSQMESSVMQLLQQATARPIMHDKSRVHVLRILLAIILWRSLVTRFRKMILWDDPRNCTFVWPK